jgi:hypothetical protein
MHVLPAMHASAARRRGMMLLIVLTLLSMFLMLGTLLIVNTSRSRLTARAFAAATASNGDSATLAKRQLDLALMKLICGPSRPAATDDITESLLEDKFGSGTALEGTLNSVEDNGPLLTASVAVNVAKPVALNGRIITFLPKPQDGGSMASYRIMRTTGTASPYTCELANLRPDRPAALPTKPCGVIVNGPEFRSEAYDAYDDNNRWLTQVTLENGAVKTVPRPTADSISILPRIRSMLRRTTSIPTPRPERSVIVSAVENPGAKIRSNTSRSSRCSSGLSSPRSTALARIRSGFSPRPSSWISMTMKPPRWKARSVMVPAGGLPCATLSACVSIP